MSKYRVYELAKDYDTTSKVIIDILARNSIVAKNHMSSVEEEAKKVIDRTFAHKTGSVAPSEEKAKPAVTPAPARPATNAPAAQLQGQTAQALPGQQQRSQGNFQQRPQGQGGQQGGFQQRPQGQGGQQGNFQQRPQGQGGQQGNFQQRPQGQGGQQGNFQQRPQGQGGQQGGFQQRPQGQGGQQGGFQQRPQGQGGQQGGFQQRPQGQGGQQGGFQQRPQGQGAQQGNFQQRPQGQGGQQGGFQQRPQGQGGQQGGFQQRPQGQGGQRPQGQGGGPGGWNNQRRNNTGGRPGQQGGNQRRGGRGGHAPQMTTPKPEPIRPKHIKIAESITVKELAVKMSREVAEVIKKFLMLGIMVTINQEVDYDTAEILAAEFQVTVEALPPEEDPTEVAEIEDDPKSLMPRSPVVTVMGHVDHGKTSLLDAIRQTRVAVTSQEAGGITQHIGAYQVMCKGKKIVFLDTPGHEAFTAMRARGAQVTDIAILVVAADDGVMPQTIEAINHAKSANVSIIVAINKMDRVEANPDRVKQQLSEYGLIPEEWGGETIMVPVSAHKRDGIEELLEMILLVAEVQELKANPNRAAMGTIIEAKLDKGRGAVATVLVQKGTLRIGDTILAGTAFGKVKALVNDRGEKVKKAEPSTPVEVLGFTDVPAAGDVMVCVEERIARSVAEKRVAKKRTEEMAHNQKVSLDDLFKQIQDGNIKDLNIVIKADVQGSVEALRQSLLGLNETAGNKEVRVNVIHSGVGAINESDVMLASASNALVIGFNVRPDANSRKAADNEKIDIRTYRVIYEALNDVEAAMTGMLAPQFKEVIQGRVEVRQVFTISKVLIAGCYVLEGKITNKSQVRVLRDSVVVHEGELESLRRFKDDVKEVATGYECGITLDKFRDLKEGDILEAFVMEEVAPKA
ncbi:translation initiation factor IF-2 [Azotosporobacter soli]|uniref:translation initiation factor IF-2 n=1 Tax=Azotosporobacter soli TaxID=3055040 RepID=UPI0031FEB9CC